jgi:Metallo-peptidase family M12/Putative metal-binding motif
MRQLILFTFFLTLSIFTALGQNRRGTIEPTYQDKTSHQFDIIANKKLKSSAESQQTAIDSRVLFDLYQQNPTNVTLPLTLDGKVVTLNMKESQLFSKNLIVELSSGETFVPEQVYCYRGYMDDHKGYAAMIVGKDFCSILFSNESGNYEINKDTKNDYYFRKSNVDTSAQCHTEDDGHAGILDHDDKSRASVANCLELYIEVDNAAYIANSSNPATVQTWVTNIFNNVATLYNNNNVPIIVSQVFIWNTADPYASATSLNGMRTAFVNRLISISLSGKVGYLLSTRAIGGGISNGIGGFCNAVNAYPSPCALSTSLATSVASYPTYTYTVQNVAHELGHVLGLRHSHACVWNGNDTQVDDCGNVIAVNTNNTPEGNCFNAGSPILPGASGGSIMSICNNLAGQSINFSVGFGPVIGDALFLNFVNATCITGTNCSTIPPNNDDCMDAIPLTLTNTCSVKTYDNNYGTQSVSTPLFSCFTQTFYTDVWFSAIVPASGSLTIETKQVASGLTDMLMQTYSGTCNALVQIACDDNNGDADHSLITLTGRTPGEKIYIRVTPKDKPGADDFGEFGMCAYDASLPCHPDYNALVAFYNSTGGPTWTNKTGWSSSATNCNVCSWYGVVCNTAGRVSSLNLGFNNLTGTIPSNITQLSYLTKINMYSNNLATGSLPSFLNTLPLLSYVDLGDNNYTGSIPSTYGSIANLRTLYLDNNTLTGTLPTSLANAPIATMWLNNNNLSGCVPSNYVALCLRNAVVRLEQNPLLPGGGDFDGFCANGFGGDLDGDGYCGGSTDCDDSNSASYPGAPEICDGKDNDCDASIDEGIPDVTNTWIGANGNWNVATNWSTGKIPEKCHNVVINPTSAYTITIPNGYTAKASSVVIGSNGTLLVQFNAILNVVDKGEVTNSGHLTLFGNVNITNPLNTSGIALTNSGTTAINSSATMTITNAGATAIRNNAASTFDINGVLDITNNHPTNGQYGIDNRGIMSNTGQVTISNINGKEIRLAVGAIFENTDLGTIEAK